MEYREEILREIEKVISEGNLENGKILIDEYKKTLGNNDEIQSMEAIINMYNENYTSALDNVREGLKYNILNSDLYFIMGNIYEALSQVDRAYLCYNKALYLCDNDDNRNEIIIALENIKNNCNVNKVSFVILTYNQLEYTKLCINSIRKHNDPNTYEIIIVDNNSTDGTVEWIKKQKDIKAIFNKDNNGFPKGCNQGIEIADKHNDIILLNNDTVIMENSIFNMRMALYSSENVGAVGAISNSVSNSQQINEDFDTFDEYIQYAQKNNIHNDKSYEERLKLVGFALMIKRNVLNKTGGLDERFTPGNFEDDDICMKITLAGYKLILPKDSFIYHFGNVSFRSIEGGYNNLLYCNYNKFVEKWKVDPYIAQRFYNNINDIISEDDKEIIDINGGSGSELVCIRNYYCNSNYYIYETNNELLALARKLNFNIVENLHNKQYEKKFDIVIVSEYDIVNNRTIMDCIKSILKDNGKIIIILDSYKENADKIYKEKIELFNTSKIEKFISKFISRNYELVKYDVCGTEDNISLATIVLKNIPNQKIIDNELNYLESGRLTKAKSYLQGIKESSMDSDNIKILNEKVEVLAEIKFLLRRFDIKNDENIIEVFDMVNENNISDECLIGIVKESMINKVLVLNFIAIQYFSSEQYERVLPYLNAALEIDNNDTDTLYNISYVLNCFGEKDKALEYLENIKQKNQNVMDLIREIKGK